MYFGVARLEFLVSQSRSLKEKRSVVSRLKGRLVSRFVVSVAEVEYQDLWQRAALGVALIAQSPSTARNGLEAIRRLVESEPRISMINFGVHVARFEDVAVDGAEMLGPLGLGPGGFYDEGRLDEDGAGPESEDETDEQGGGGR